MKRIYTRTGDEGTTSIRGGERVDKDDIRIETNGCLDELNAVIGIVRSLLPKEHSWQALLRGVQEELMVIMSHVATPVGKSNPRPLHVSELTALYEEEMDDMLARLQPSTGFVLPGGSVVSAQLHFARTVARRAERRFWTLHRHYPQDEGVLRYLNRLSDLLFVMARTEVQCSRHEEEKWQR